MFAHVDALGAFAAGCKDEVIIAVSGNNLGIRHAVIIIIVAIVTGRAYKLFIQQLYKIVVYIYHLIGAAQHF